MIDHLTVIDVILGYGPDGKVRVTCGDHLLYRHRETHAWNWDQEQYLKTDPSWSAGYLFDNLSDAQDALREYAWEERLQVVYLGNDLHDNLCLSLSNVTLTAEDAREALNYIVESS